MIFLQNLFKGVWLATLSFNRYNMAQGLLRRSCFKTTPSPTPTLKKFLIFFLTIYLEKKLSYLIIRSGKFGNLVTSFFLTTNNWKILKQLTRAGFQVYNHILDE